MVKNVFVTATKPADGKTVITLGLVSALVKMGKNVGFLKPVIQESIERLGRKIDEDTLLVTKACNIHCNLEDMSCVSLSSFGYKHESADPRFHLSYLEKIENCYKRIAQDKDIVVIEGTGNAALGSIYGLSNAFLAKTFDAKVILVTSGGVGQPIDEVELNRRYFNSFNSERLIGVIINKAYPGEIDSINNFTRKVFNREKIKLLGVIPFCEEIYTPTIMDVLPEIRGEILVGEAHLNRRIKRVYVGAMTAHNAIRKLDGEALLITPGDRDDIILTAITINLAEPKRFRLIGVVLSGGLTPANSIIDLCRKLNIPLIRCADDSYAVAVKVNNAVVKISPNDKEKIDMINKLFEENVNVDEIIRSL